MSNSKANFIDPSVFLQAAAAGAAQSPGDRSAAAWALILKALNTHLGYETVDTTATALDITLYKSELAISGTMTATLAAPTFAGQEKRITAISAAATPKLTLTVSSPDDTAGFVCAGTFIFDTVGQEIELRATAALKWRATRIKRAGGTADNVVVGTTVLTGYNLWLQYCLSVDGTKSSTTTMGLPNGSSVGERITLINTTASNTPIGSIDGTYKGGLAAAYTHLGAIGVVASTTVVGDTAVLEWDGSSWVVIYQNGCTLS